MDASFTAAVAAGWDGEVQAVLVVADTLKPASAQAAGSFVTSACSIAHAVW